MTKTKIEWTDFRKGHSRIHAHNGYFLIYCPGHPFAKSKGHVYEHRYLIEKFLKRFLMPKEHVHHKNGNPSDNSLENLELINPCEHARHHQKLIPIEEKRRRTIILVENQKKKKKPRFVRLCYCGCGQIIKTPDSKGRDKKFVRGHNQKGRHWEWKKNYG